MKKFSKKLYNNRLHSNEEGNNYQHYMLLICLTYTTILCRIVIQHFGNYFSFFKTVIAISRVQTVKMILYVVLVILFLLILFSVIFMLFKSSTPRNFSEFLMELKIIWFGFETNIQDVIFGPCYNKVCK